MLLTFPCVEWYSSILIAPELLPKRFRKSLTMTLDVGLLVTTAHCSIPGRCMEYEAEERPSADETRAWLEVRTFNVLGGHALGIISRHWCGR